MKPRKIIKKIHLWLTLIFFLPLVIQGLTGTILVFEHEIEDLISGNFQEYKLPETSKNQSIQKIEDIIAIAAKEVPEKYSPTLIKFSENEPATINFMAGRSSRISVAVDPHALEILGVDETKPNAVLKFLHQLHTNLLITGKTGRDIIGYVGVIMLLMLISGIIIWFPKQISRLKEGFFFKMSDIGYNFHRSLHKAVGIWTYLIFFIVTFSGVYISLPQYVEPIFSKTKMRERITLPKTESNIIKINEAVAITRNIFKEEKIIAISIPHSSERPYKISLEPRNYISGGPMINVNINPVNGEIIKIQNPNEYTIGQTILAWQTPLHYGQAFGDWYKILVFITGFLPLLFTITGIAMWWKKKQGKKKIKNVVA